VVEEIYAKIQADETLARSLGLVDGLGISTLRGEYADNREWSVSTSQEPSVVQLGQIQNQMELPVQPPLVQATR
jgi:hypothetical protein